MTRINRKFTYSIVAMVIALAISSPAVTAQNGDEPERSLAGVWQSRILPHNCTTGVPIPTAAFESLFTFNSDGTMSAWVQNAVVTVTRGPAHGLWRRDRGWSEYSFKIVHMRYNLTTGAFNGKQESGGTLALSDTGDEFTTEGWTQQFDAAGNPFPQQGCSTSVGTRFKLDE